MDAARQPPLEVRVTLAQLDYGDNAGPARAARGHRRSRRRARAARTCTADQVVIVSGAQHGLEWICRLLIDPGDTAWMEEPGYPGARGALDRGGRAHPAGPGGRARPERREGHTPRRRCAAGVRHAVTSVSARGDDEPAAAARAAGVARLRARG